MFFLWLIVALVCGGIGLLVGSGRNRPGAGAALGFFLGPIGCLATLFLPKE